MTSSGNEARNNATGVAPGQLEVKPMPVVDLGPLKDKIAVRPAEACAALSVGMTRLYELMNTGDLVSYRDGGSRRITVSSIRAFIEGRIAASIGEAA